MKERFGYDEAVKRLKDGKKVAREGWNGKGMYLWLLPEAEVHRDWCKDPRLLECFEEGEDTLLCLGSIRMYTINARGRKAVLTGWLASQSDMLENDWVEIL